MCKSQDTLKNLIGWTGTGEYWTVSALWCWFDVEDQTQGQFLKRSETCSPVLRPSLICGLTVSAEGRTAEQRRVQHSEHLVFGVDVAAIFIQQGEDVFVHQEDHVHLLVHVVHHQTLQ